MMRQIWRATCFGLLGLIVSILFTPTVSAGQPRALPLQVVVNEVAWMGTDAAAADEWLELYNPTAQPISLANWQLTDTVGTLYTFGPSDSITAGGYFLLEANESATSVPSNALFTGALNNSGETLTLLDEQSLVVDQLPFDGGWLAGSNSFPKKSMERSSASLPANTPNIWVSNNGVTRNGAASNGSPLNGTPGQPNAAVSTTYAVIVSESDGNTNIVEGGATDSYTISLSALPSVDVQVVVQAADAQIDIGAGAGVGRTLLFTPANATTPQTIMVSAVDDSTAEAAHSSSITHQSTSADPNFNGLSAATVQVNIQDNDTLAPGAVVISEIAWMGTRAANGYTHEWIELYNASSNLVSLSNWRLSGGDGSPNILMPAIQLAAGDYVLLEKDSDNATSLAADVIYTGALLDAGESLTLRDANNTLIDLANTAGLAWPAGKAGQLAASMERNFCPGESVPADGFGAWRTHNTQTRNATDADGNPVNGTPRRASSHCEATAAPSSPLIISEIAWAGTLSSFTAEWIELHNISNMPQPIGGWVLESWTEPFYNAVVIPPGTVLPAGGFYLLEKDSDSTIADIPANQIYTESLANSGETLLLLDASGQIYDTANASGGAWPAGTNSVFDTPPYASMERAAPNTADQWVTNNGVYRNGTDQGGQPIYGSPGQVNSAWLPPSTLTPVFPTPVLTPAPPVVVPSGLHINELVVSPGSSWAEFGLPEIVPYEFVEVANFGSTPADLSAFRLMSPSGYSHIFPPASFIQPGELWIINDLGLSNSGGCVGLFTPDLTTKLDAVCYTADQVMGRRSFSWDGSAWQYDWMPTPGMSNKGAGCGTTVNRQPCPQSVQQMRAASIGHWGTLTGTITVPPGVFDPNELYLQDESGRGLLVQLASGAFPALQLGQTLTVWGNTRDWQAELALLLPNDWQLQVGALGSPVLPTRVSTAQLQDPAAETWEGNLVQVQGRIISVSNFSFVVDDGGGAVRVFLSRGISKPFALHAGETVRVTGIVGQVQPLPGSTATPGYRLSLRYDSDLLRLDPLPMIQPASVWQTLPLGSYLGVQGVVVVPPGTFGDSIYLRANDDGSAQPLGLRVYLASRNWPNGIQFGSGVTVYGELREYLGERELYVFNVADVQLQAPRLPLPSPLLLLSHQLQPAQVGSWGYLVGRVTRVSDFTVTLNDGVGELRVFFGDNSAGKPSTVKIGQIFQATGMLGYVAESTAPTAAVPGFRLTTLQPADFVLLADPPPLALNAGQLDAALAGRLATFIGQVVRVSDFTVVLSDGAGELRIFFNPAIGKPANIILGQRYQVKGIFDYVAPESEAGGNAPTPGFRLTVSNPADFMWLADTVAVLDITAAKQQPLDSILGVRGVVSTAPGVLGDAFYLQDAAGNGLRIYVNGGAPALHVGQVVQAYGMLVDYQGELELVVNAENQVFAAAVGDAPVARVVRTGRLRQADAGSLVQVNGRIARIAENTLTLNDGSGSVRIFFGAQSGGMPARLRVGLPFTAIGVVGYVSAGGAAVPGVRLTVRTAGDFYLTPR
jgi:predicted extracellular nuclease